MRKSIVEDNPWVSFSDLMTGLMIIFLFIAINYIVQVIEYKFVSQDIYNKLQLGFIGEIDKGLIELGPDGMVRFNPKNDSILFKPGEWEMTDYFSKSLNEFIPKYISIITDSSYIDYIKEIRIEGHTDTVPPKDKKSYKDSYEYNLELSFKRAFSVLKFIRSNDSYKKIDKKGRDRLEFLFTANGLSFSHALNKDQKLVYVDPFKTIDNNSSRRVEFRVVTSNEKLIEKILSE